MAGGDFWTDKNKAQEIVREYNELKKAGGGVNYDGGDAVITIFSGAGGDDAEDFTGMLLEMYRKFFARKGWNGGILNQNQNDHGGFRSVTVEINGKDVYGTLKNESGVHRLVRISPFNAQKKRQTSFSMVEVIPKLPPTDRHLTFRRASLRLRLRNPAGRAGRTSISARPRCASHIFPPSFQSTSRLNAVLRKTRKRGFR